MPANFISNTGLYLIVMLGLFRAVIVGQAVAQTSPADEPYSLSYAAGGYDAQGNFLGGTEQMNLTPYEGKLYAGLGYFMDQPQLFPQHLDPKSGAQILVLDSSNAQWQQEYVFSQKDAAGGFEYTRISTMQVIQFHNYDANGNIIGLLAEMLVVGTGDAVYTQLSPGTWEDTQIPATSPIRSLAVYYDPTDGTEKLYAGGGVQGNVVNQPVFSGVYNPAIPGRIQWNPTPEYIGVGGRVMSIAACDGALFAAARPSIFRRNNALKSWELVYSFPITNQFDLSKSASGFRALTCVDAPHGEQALLGGFEGIEGDILRIGPQTGAAVVELHTRRFLTQQWGVPPAAPDIIAGYDEMPAISSGTAEIRLIGLLALDFNNLNASWFLSRTTSYPPAYELCQIDAPTTWPYNRSDGALWSVRETAVSPFAEDQGQILYVGGYDSHYHPDHNTAWIERVGINTALQGCK